MCLPYMKKRAESLSDKIIHHSPNGILTVDSSLRVQLANRAALEILNAPSEDAVVGRPIGDWMDDFEFITAFSSGEHTKFRKAYLAQYDKYVEQVFTCDPSNNMVICLMKDITQAEKDPPAAAKEQRRSGGDHRPDHRQTDAHRPRDRLAAGRDGRRDQSGLDPPEKHRTHGRGRAAMNRLFMESGFVSLNKQGEDLCGDFFHHCGR